MYPWQLGLHDKDLCTMCINNCTAEQPGRPATPQWEMSQCGTHACISCAMCMVWSPKQVRRFFLASPAQQSVAARLDLRYEHAGQLWLAHPARAQLLLGEGQLVSRVLVAKRFQEAGKRVDALRRVVQSTPCWRRCWCKRQQPLAQAAAEIARGRPAERLTVPHLAGHLLDTSLSAHCCALVGMREVPALLAHPVRAEGDVVKADRGAGVLQAFQQ